MRFSSLTFFAALLLATACGGNVVVDHNSAGAGASAGSSPGVGGATGVGGGSGTGGALIGSAGVTSTAASGAGAGLPACVSLGYVGVGDKCGQEGQECTMPGTCCGAPIVCQNGQWAMTGLTCQQPCETCGGPLGCSPNAVCIEDQIHDIETAFRCAANPCPSDEPPDCNCAGALCTDASLMCVGGSGSNMLVCSDGTK